jgi:hypothetical protein
MTFADNNAFPEDWADQEPPDGDEDAPPEIGLPYAPGALTRYWDKDWNEVARIDDRPCNGDCGVCQTLTHPTSMRGNAFHITTKEP